MAENNPKTAPELTAPKPEKKPELPPLSEEAWQRFERGLGRNNRDKD